LEFLKKIVYKISQDKQDNQANFCNLKKSSQLTVATVGYGDRPETTRQNWFFHFYLPLSGSTASEDRRTPKA
jgi:hypothetical protein